MMKFLKKNLTNILFIGFFIFLLTPYGLPVRAILIKGVSFVTTRVLSLETDKEDQPILNDYNWQLLDLNGQAVNMRDARKKVVIVNFWATWCPPCIAEMPSFEALYETYGDRVVFLFVANDQKEKVSKFLKDKGYKLPVYFQVTRAPEQLNSNSLPTTYIIGPDGNIVVKKVGAVDWNSDKVARLLDRLLS